MLNCSYQDRCTLLLLALQTKDPQLYIHSRRVQQLTQYLTRALHLSGAQRATIVLAALLHDIGKLVIRDEVLQKPSRLKQEEFEHIKQHPTSGALILRQMGMPHDIVLLVSQHHECWDGSGYPGGLCGETIPLGAHIATR